MIGEVRIGRKAAPNQYVRADFGYYIIIDSPKYGLRKVKISECDYAAVRHVKWCVSLNGNNHSNVNSHKLYASSSGDDLKCLMHRYVLDAPKGMVVDHINGDGLDNRRENLRVCTQSQNRINADRLPHHNATGVIGVCWNTATQKWLAYICKNYKQMLLGNYDSFDDAVTARRNAEASLFPNIKKPIN